MDCSVVPANSVVCRDAGAFTSDCSTDVFCEYPLVERGREKKGEREGERGKGGRDRRDGWMDGGREGGREGGRVMFSFLNQFKWS